MTSRTRARALLLVMLVPAICCAGQWTDPSGDQLEIATPPRLDLVGIGLFKLHGTLGGRARGAVVVGMEGQEQEISYDRLDDGATPGHADLKRSGEQVMTAGDIACCYPEHIHSVWNVGPDISMSLHTYGRHINYTGRSEFDVEGKREKPYLIKVANDEPVQA